MEDQRLSAYIGSMSIASGAALLAATVLLTEGLAYAVHRWVMHGPGWFLHRSHHCTRDGWWEANDWYAAVFAVPSVLLIYAGMHGWWDGLAWIGAGVAVYGVVYFGFHDVIVHRRVPHRYVPRWAYMKRIVQAHRLHHAVGDKDGSVSFGFLWAPDPKRLKQHLSGVALRSGKGAVDRS